ncbi:ADP-ribosylation factor-like protein 6-interacting protein 4, partial [Austrofundulus limnaeus]|uniref:ADP-ribosylation factor-like protein 6-interacting protein 4 n=1 Tax=Austrofundulus limnaeus TaxID=52670 RepID=A0A2I4AKJ4_AUSLI
MLTAELALNLSHGVNINKHWSNLDSAYSYDPHQFIETGAQQVDDDCNDFPERFVYDDDHDLDRHVMGENLANTRYIDEHETQDEYDPTDEFVDDEPLDDRYSHDSDCDDMLLPSSSLNSAATTSKGKKLKRIRAVYTTSDEDDDEASTSRRGGHQVSGSDDSPTKKRQKNTDTPTKKRHKRGDHKDRKDKKDRKRKDKKIKTSRSDKQQHEPLQRSGHPSHHHSTWFDVKSESTSTNNPKPETKSVTDAPPSDRGAESLDR